VRAAATILLAALSLASIAYAQDEAAIPERRMGVRWRSDGVPEVHFSAADFVDHHVRELLDSGIPQNLVMRIYGFADDGSPIALEPRSCRVVYLPWERIYRVQVRTRHRDVTEVHAALEAVIARCLVVDHLAVGTRTEWSGRTGRFYFAMMLELNPMSPDTIQRLRRWLAQPAAGGRVGGDAFFGSFVSLFVNRRIGSADRTLRFRSQRVTR
jgi:hypothetical protein